MPTLVALTVIVPGVGGVPVLQLEVAFEPGVIVTVHVAPGANGPVHVVGTVVMFVPVGSPVAETESSVAGFIPVFLIVMYRAFPVNGELLTDSASMDGGAMLVLNVVAQGAVVRVITKVSPELG